MKLLHCRLSSVRRHRELTLAFDPGLTLITGANETGKSSLVEALHRTLAIRRWTSSFKPADESGPSKNGSAARAARPV